MKVVVIGSGKLANAIVAQATEIDLKILTRQDLDITDRTMVFSVIAELSNQGYTHIVHTAVFGKPMNAVDNNPYKAIDTNIIGTGYISQACIQYGLKLVYISTDYVYGYSEEVLFEDGPIQPKNKYAWTKLGGECAVMQVPNSLILRCAITDIPFKHAVAYNNVYKNSITHVQVARLLLKLLNESGIINVGGTSETVYDFARRYGNIDQAACDNPNQLTTKMSTKKLNNLLSNC